jgi:hypothetical protein
VIRHSSGLSARLLKSNYSIIAHEELPESICDDEEVNEKKASRARKKKEKIPLE